MLIFCPGVHSDLPVEEDSERMSGKPCLEGRKGLQALRMKGRSGAQHESDGQTLLLRPRQVREFTQHGKVAALVLNRVKRHLTEYQALPYIGTAIPKYVSG